MSSNKPGCPADITVAILMEDQIPIVKQAMYATFTFGETREVVRGSRGNGAPDEMCCTGRRTLDLHVEWTDPKEAAAYEEFLKGRSVEVIPPTNPGDKHTVVRPGTICPTCGLDPAIVRANYDGGVCNTCHTPTSARPCNCGATLLKPRESTVCSPETGTHTQYRGNKCDPTRGPGGINVTPVESLAEAKRVLDQSKSTTQEMQDLVKESFKVADAPEYGPTQLRDVSREPLSHKIVDHITDLVDLLRKQGVKKAHAKAIAFNALPFYAALEHEDLFKLTSEREVAFEEIFATAWSMVNAV